MDGNKDFKAKAADIGNTTFNRKKVITTTTLQLRKPASVLVQSVTVSCP